ncbi:hypothetical protein HAX54_038444 [Datura stramonium]|uniref:Uncharacterized protein n=1 Tax=Datura stramonium TaxID=4076 RepID=A0ABS8VL33_DATST|nr:hypothetical protein [Datura stramonium]
MVLMDDERFFNQKANQSVARNIQFTCDKRIIGKQDQNVLSGFQDAPVGPSPQTDLITKTPSKSRTSVLYKFSSDYVLREQYRNPWNEIRMGKLLEDLDALAGTISFKLC